MSALLAGLSNAELLERVRALIQRGNALEAELLAHIGEVDARQLYLEQGCSSMFTYCVNVLHFAEGVEYKRIQAARAARAHPGILEAMRSGDCRDLGPEISASERSAVTTYPLSDPPRRLES